MKQNELGLKVLVQGIPIAKIRSRTFTRGGVVRSFDPQHAEKLNVKKIMLSQIITSLDINDKQKLCVEIRFFMPYPKLSTPQLNLLKWDPDSPHKDLDNLVKFYLDCGNGILWHDDRQIISLTTTKEYSENPHTEIFIQMKNSEVLKQQEKQILSIYEPEQLRSLVDELEGIYSDLLIWDMHPDDRSLPEGQSILSRIAYRLSKFADAHEAKLRAINKKCPKYWQECSNSGEEYD